MFGIRGTAASVRTQAESATKPPVEKKNAAYEFFRSVWPLYHASPSTHCEATVMPLFSIPSCLETALDALQAELGLEAKQVLRWKDRIQNAAREACDRGDEVLKRAWTHVHRTKKFVDAMAQAAQDAFTETFHLEQTFDFSPCDGNDGAESRYEEARQARPWLEMQYRWNCRTEQAWSWATWGARVAGKTAVTAAGAGYGGVVGGVAAAEACGLLREIPNSVKEAIFLAALSAWFQGDPNAITTACVALYGDRMPQAGLWVMQQAWACAAPLLPALVKGHISPKRIAEFICRFSDGIHAACQEWKAQAIDEFCVLESNGDGCAQGPSGPFWHLADRLYRVGVVALTTAAGGLASGLLSLFTVQKDSRKYYNALLSAYVGRCAGLYVGAGFAVATTTTVGEKAIDAATSGLKQAVGRQSQELFAAAMDWAFAEPGSA